MEEVWKDIKDYEGLYQVSNWGRIKSCARYKKNHNKLQFIDEKIKSTRRSNSGYLNIDLYKNNIGKTFKVHRLVAEAFIENENNKPTVNHIDGDKLNNNVNNLEWATYKEQNEHFYKYLYNAKNGNKESINNAIKAMIKVTSKKVKCLNNGKIYNSASEAARQIGVSPSLIMRCCRGESKTAKGYNWIYI